MAAHIPLRIGTMLGGAWIKKTRNMEAFGASSPLSTVAKDFRQSNETKPLAFGFVLLAIDFPGHSQKFDSLLWLTVLVCSRQFPESTSELGRICHLL